ncbi:hypothetical protein GCM10022254_69980 [Actinomadura meridiana]|uniref:DUF2812 domain-containing protein n=1 Tax=Actinomadura meridiana TaxID=559626 RepID=A0ABP8CN92_9ACTN
MTGSGPMTTPYFEELAERLRAGGVPADEVAGTVDDLAAYVAESGADPRDEFGEPEEFAARLAPSGGGAVPEPSVATPSEETASAETWRWTADAFHERRLLNRFGEEGWEVERVDSLGRFVSHRDIENPQRWEYRRETVLPARRAAAAERLAPDGWEPCGSWVCFEYFKRPKAASLGPEAELDDPPMAPARHIFWSRRFAIFIVCYSAFWIAMCAVWLLVAPGEDRSRFLLGCLVGAVLAVAMVVTVRWRQRAR